MENLFIITVYSISYIYKKRGLNFNTFLFNSANLIVTFNIIININTISKRFIIFIINNETPYSRSVTFLTT